MYKIKRGTRKPQGTAGAPTTITLDVEHLGCDRGAVTVIHGRNGLGDKVPGEEEHQIRPRTEARGGRRDQDGMGMAGGGAG